MNASLRFPEHISDLDHTGSCLDGGTALINEEHPGFNDMEYRKRRDMIVEMAKQFKYGDKLPHVEYTTAEVKTWGTVWERLRAAHDKYACDEYKNSIDELSRGANFNQDRIPQLEDISRYLRAKNGFQLRPVMGLLSARDFLNALAFRTFFSTQYIR